MASVACQSRNCVLYAHSTGSVRATVTRSHAVWHAHVKHLSSRPAETRCSRPNGRREGTATRSFQSLVSMAKRHSSSSATRQSSSAAMGQSHDVARPSASIILLSQTNEVLLLHRVQTSSAFPSAHVFPGGNLDVFHEGTVMPTSENRHVDGAAYRFAAVRETFEESGILLARKTRDGSFLRLPDDDREAGRMAVHAKSVKFEDWLKDRGAKPDIDQLLPFTRWITPRNQPKRFTTQMYIYMLPLLPPSTNAGSASPSSTPFAASETIVPRPTPDGGLEHTAAAFAPPSTWLSRLRAAEIVLFPPQLYLLTLLAETFAAAPPTDYAAQRAALSSLLDAGDTGVGGDGGETARKCAAVPWRLKTISPRIMGTLPPPDGRLVLALHDAGPELAGEHRAGDWERVVAVRFGKDGPREGEVRLRKDVVPLLREQGKSGAKERL